MAIKLMGVEGAASGSQDFVMITSKEFFSRDGADYLKLHRALMGNAISIPFYFATHPKNIAIVLRGRQKLTSPLAGKYFSAVPYKLGPRTMKFKVMPCADNAAGETLPSPDVVSNYLRHRLVSRLTRASACFHFYLQPNQEPDDQRVEDPRIAWDEERSPYIQVATLRIPQQTGIDSRPQLNFCENLSMNPWHTRSETRPMGQINRMRARIYTAISEFRHSRNQIPVLEPVSHTPCVGPTAGLCMAPR